MSNWEGVQSVPPDYVYPPEKRPGNVVVPMANTIPVLDLSTRDRPLLVRKILDASQEFGFFQVSILSFVFFDISDSFSIMIDCFVSFCCCYVSNYFVFVS